MSAEENERFELMIICWICDGLFEISDEKVRDHCDITGNVEMLHIGVVILI